MTRKKIIFGISALAAVIAVILVISLCAHDRGKNKYTASLYFYNENATTIESENRVILYSQKQDLTQSIVGALLTGPENSRHHRVIAPDARLISVSGVEGGELLVNFSREFKTGDDKKDILAVYSVVKSLCSVNGVYSVKVVVEGTDIVSEDGSIIGYLTDQDINLSTDTVSTEVRKVTLYFPSSAGGMLGKERRSIRVTDQQPLAQYIINELIKGPQTDGLSGSLNSETSLHSVEIQNGICFVNFRSNFIEKNTGDAEWEKLTIFSIVNSLTERDNIERVKFLIDGKRADKFGNIDISGLFMRDESIIGGLN